MSIIFKTILSSVAANKRRTALLVICMAVVSFAAMMTLSMSDAADIFIDDYVSQEYGDAKIYAVNDGISTELPELPDNADGMFFYCTSIHTQHHSADNFSYAAKYRYSVIGLDTEKARQKRYIVHSEPFSLRENEIIITDSLAEAENWHIGSTIDILTAAGEDMTLTVRYIVPDERYLKERGPTVIAEIPLVEKIESKQGCWNSCNISLKDDADVSAVINDLESRYKNIKFEDIRAVSDGMASTRIAFMAMFMILTIIIFIVVSGVSEHIIRERTAQTGTLRSIGSTRAMASAALICENLFYSIPGAAIGILIFIPSGSFIADDLVGGAGMTGADFHIRVSHVLMVLLLTIAVSFLSPMRAVIRSVKTPVRDIIFGGRDKPYNLSVPRAAAGFSMIAAGTVCGLAIDNAAVILLSIIAVTVGSIFFIPLFIDLISRFSGKAHDPVLCLALKNTASNKTIISSTILFSVVAGLAGAIWLETCHTRNDIENLAFSGDIIISSLSDETDNYRFISSLENVDRTEFVYMNESRVRINGAENGIAEMTAAYDPENRLFNGIRGIDRGLSDDEVSIDERLMKSLGIHEGDKVEITFNADGERPIELQLTAVRGCDTSAVSFMGTSVVISPSLYKKCFFDYPSEAVISLREPKKVSETISLLRTYIMDKTAKIRSYESYREMMLSGSQSIMMLLYLIIAAGCLLALIMFSANLSIGFEQRRKELAVLHSTSMSRSQLERMLFSETAMSLVFSTVWAVVWSGICYLMLIKFVDSINGVSSGMPEELHRVFTLPAIMCAAGLAVSYFSRNKLKKMNTAMEMKYE